VRVKLILALLALLTGMAGSDSVRITPTTPAALGAVVLIADQVQSARQHTAASHPMAAAPRRVLNRCAHVVRTLFSDPVSPGLTPRGMRARE
jgi:hypothetical protein